MIAKPLIRLAEAQRDELDAVAYYAREAGLDVAFRISAELRDAYRAIADRPGTGSPRYADLLGIAELRSRKLKRFPFLIFYLEYSDRIDVWRILHAQRDVPASLGGDDAE